jgi:hypothetical protein
MEPFDPPKLRNDFVIVANSEKYNLAALALSYLSRQGEYIPVFSFRDVDVAIDTPKATPDIYLIQTKRAHEFSVLLNNAIIENGGCENLIYIGLTENQKSYLKLHVHYNVFEIEDSTDVESYLGGFAYNKGSAINCDENQIATGLAVALHENRLLQLGVYNPDLSPDFQKENNGIVIIEFDQTIETIISIEYANSINAKIIFVEKLLEDEEHDVLYLLERWSVNEDGALDSIKEKINSRIIGIDFSNYKYATCFTKGLPYGMCITTAPVSQINLDYRPDFFIFNALVNEKNKISGSAVIFSPTFFAEEETNQLCSLLEFENFYQRKLIGKAATSYTLKNTIQNYPFDLLHICSHGGGVNGTSCAVEFMGDDDATHKIEFDHVLGIALTPYEDMHGIESIYYFKKLDGLVWRSESLKAKGYSKELYASIQKEISLAFDKKKVIYGDKIDRVTNTNSIKCSDFNYLANFDQIGAYNSHPFIFNNSCWSWFTISTSFLVAGARGYIGTVRDIDNDVAVRFSKVFYDAVFSGSIVEAMHVATIDLLTHTPESLYVFWGLHCTTLKNTNPVNINKTRVLEALGASKGTWMRKRDKSRGDGLKRIVGIIKDVDWLVKDVVGTTTENSPR